MIESGSKFSKDCPTVESPKPLSSLKLAMTVLFKINALYYQEYREYCVAFGGPLCGPQGIPGYSTVEQVLSAVERRKRDIEDIRAKMDNSNPNSSSEALAKIYDIAKELGVNVDLIEEKDDAQS